ncbi:putative surface protein with fasciclin (FAS1) repeats [Rhodococcus sp. PvR044]|uniref:fasciclin domain-containing protein n=1 Tax=Rhodococcus TaxID=1827 RepID=UPI000BCE09F7|nr:MULTISPECIES: fasciclin domain-containing protein [Rhodococcus]MBP1160458.1 putative surface protein with fasciclin (FAS1) repeats [Rhodococcus sp. PvR099]MCZ4556194.1 fasciclin domain-containing protein [Rhodococcus maanshanensis]PTR36842.1 putative surface protein with fasciclin (FAS1) repeats [Rhodococcus sp. OK611]SNX93573.1 Uncaracterized surface protein containing fasciclin (FAS1) repeats [Rhodococcus sp. OK270]
MNSSKRKILTAFGVSAVAVLGLGACSSNDSNSSSASESAAAPQTETSESMDGSDAMASSLVGPGCAGYAEQVPTGPGSVDGMAQDPVAVAASNNPMLTTLTAAVSGQLNPDVNLVDTLNGGQFTVFAPVDSAFAKVDPATIDSLKTDSATLTKVLTYHVVPGRIAPSDIEGTQTTVEGGTVEVTGSGDNWKVNEAGVICGGVQTANATVYLIDSVLMPK